MEIPKRRNEKMIGKICRLIINLIGGVILVVVLSLGWCLFHLVKGVMFTPRSSTPISTSEVLFEEYKAMYELEIVQAKLHYKIYIMEGNNGA